MALNKTVAEGLMAIARAAGGNDPVKAAKVAVAATQVAGNLASAARRATGAVRDAVEKQGENPTSAGPTPPPQNPIDEAATQAQAKPEAGGMQSLLAGALAAYRKECVAAGLNPDRPSEALAKAGQAVRTTLPVIMSKTGDLVDMAAPAGADGLKRLGRGLAKRLSGADVAAEIGRFDTWKDKLAGFSKLTYFVFLLRRMNPPDVGVFQSLDAFSNHNTERNKALTKIVAHIYDLPVDAETAIATLRGFQLTNGKPDYNERKIALETLAGNLDRDEVPRVLTGYSDDEQQRLEALRVVAELYGSIPAVEMVELLKVFGPTTRAKARYIVEPKLGDRDNIQLIDDLFEPKKKIADLPELKRLKGSFEDLMSGFAKGRQK